MKRQRYGWWKLHIKSLICQSGDEADEKADDACAYIN